jgi:cell division protein FtsB
MTVLWRFFPLLVATGLGLAGYWYVSNMQSDIKDLVAKNQSLSLEIETERLNNKLALENIDRLRDAQNQLVKSVQEMRDNQIVARAELERLDDIFSEHNFGALAQAKPGLVENRVNRGTTDIIRMLECATGKSRPDC